MSATAAAPMAAGEPARTGQRAAFVDKLREETTLLRAREEQGTLSHRAPGVSVVLQAWLIDVEGRPAPRSAQFVAALASPAVAAGPAKYQIELRLGPCPLARDGLARLAVEWQTLWARCHETAQGIGMRVIAAGILPTIDDADVVASQLSDPVQYAQRYGRNADPLTRLTIESAREQLHFEHRHVFPAIAVASMSVQLQVGPEAGARFFNAAIIASAPAAGLAANAPFLFGTDLWDDTRLPLLEQAVAAAAPAGAASLRCGLGTQYLGSLTQYFEAALAAPAFASLEDCDPPAQRFEHLRRHAETLHHWVRPRLSFDDGGTPLLQIEQCVMSPGPTAVDMLANTCFFLGVASSLATEPDAPETRLPFDLARASMYAAARMGLQAEVSWLDGETMPLRTLAIVDLLDRAYDGLHELGVADDVARRHLSIIERRVASGQTAAVWQRRFVNAHGRNFALLMRETAARQLGGAPVHEWHLRRLT